MAHRRRRVLLPVCRALLHASAPESSASCSVHESTAWQCPKCQGPMYIVERLTAQILNGDSRWGCFVDTS
jgi:hypothetical protein